MFKWLIKAPQVKRPAPPALPDPNAEPTEEAAAATAAVNKVIQEEIFNPPAAKKQKRDYNVHPPEFRAKVAKYALETNNCKAARHFSTKEKKLGESTVRKWVKQLKETMKSDGIDYSDVKALEPGTKGRPTLLPKDIDSMTQSYLKKLRLAGGIVSGKIAIATANGLVRHHDRTLLRENGGPIHLTRTWAESLFTRMEFVKRKGTKAARKLPNDFPAIKEEYLRDIQEKVSKHKIPDELIINFDQTGVSIVPVDDWTMEEKGSKDVGITGLGDKRQITMLLSYSLSLDMLPAQVIYKGTTKNCHADYPFPDDWNITHSKNHWSNSETMIEYFDKVLFPYISKVKKDLGLPEEQKSLIIFDLFKAHQKEEVINHLKNNHCRMKYVPASCTGDLQPLDASGNKKLKDSLEDDFSFWYSEEVADNLRQGIDLSALQVKNFTMTRMKPLHAKWPVKAFDSLKSSPTVILKGWEITGIRQAVDSAR